MPYLQGRLLDGATVGKRQRPRQSRLESDIHGIETGGGKFPRLSAREKRNPRHRGGHGTQQALDRRIGYLIDIVCCVAQLDPGRTMLGFRIIPSSLTRCE